LIAGTTKEIHYGLVVANDDEEKRGRLRVASGTLAGSDDQGDPIELPDWIEPVFPYLSSEDDQGATGGWFFVPDVGVTVELEINIQSPRDEAVGQISLDAADIRWRACIFAPAKDSLHEDFDTNYPNRRGIVTGRGHQLIFDDTEGDEEVRLLQVNEHGNSFLDFDENGSATLLTSQGMLLYMNQDAGELTLTDSQGNVLGFNSSGCYLTNGNGATINLTKDLIQLLSNANLALNTTAFTCESGGAKFYQTQGLESAVLKDGTSSFVAALATYIAEVATALTGVGGTPPPSGTGFITNLSGGMYTSTNLEAE
jgi:hypothetical protein